LLKAFTRKRGAIKIKKGERLHTCYLLKLKGGSLIKIIAKELVSGRLDFFLVAEHGSEKRTLMRVKDIEREHYHQVVAGLAMQLCHEGLLLDAKAIYSKEGLKLIE